MKTLLLDYPCTVCQAKILTFPHSYRGNLLAILNLLLTACSSFSRYFCEAFVKVSLECCESILTLLSVTLPTNYLPKNNGGRKSVEDFSAS
jgi:hypothetical protein